MQQKSWLKNADLRDHLMINKIRFFIVVIQECTAKLWCTARIRTLCNQLMNTYEKTNIFNINKGTIACKTVVYSSSMVIFYFNLSLNNVGHRFIA